MKSSRGEGLAAHGLGQLEQDFGVFYAAVIWSISGYRNPIRLQMVMGECVLRTMTMVWTSMGAHARTTAAIHIHLFPRSNSSSPPYGEYSKTPVTHDP